MKRRMSVSVAVVIAKNETLFNSDWICFSILFNG